MTTLTMRTNPMKRGNRNSLWPQFDAASSALVSSGPKSTVGFGRLHGLPPVPSC